MDLQTTSRRGSAVVTLPSDTEIHITRIFDAPAALIFDAWTTPEYVRRWFGVGHGDLVVCDVDLRVGGNWRFVQRGEDGTEHGFHGTYREIDRPHRLVSTWVYEGVPDAEAVETLTLVEEKGTTVLTVNSLHPSRAVRDGHVEAGMEDGMQASLDALEEITR